MNKNYYEWKWHNLLVSFKILYSLLIRKRGHLRWKGIGKGKLERYIDQTLSSRLYDLSRTTTRSRILAPTCQPEEEVSQLLVAHNS